MPPSDPSSKGRAARAAVQRLESLQRAGVTHVPRRSRKAVAPAREAESIASPPAHPLVAAITSAPAPPKRSAGSAIDGLAILQQEVCACEACELSTSRTQTVFGVGNPQAKICFLGEAPGADEDAQGEPFVGRAGQLLTKIIEACKLSREDVYILNVLKCRPPGNRNPLPHEVSACRGFFEGQLALIKPEYIVCLGTIAAQSLLQTDQTIGKLRGKFFEFRGVKVLCTYHPAYLLRNPAAKKDVWDDMKMLMRDMGVEL
jgi:uracil-DNA glycosylase